MAPEYQGKLCPALTAAGWNNPGWPSREGIPCRESACQLWWRCREPQASVQNREAVQPQPCEGDLKAKATRLVGDLLVMVGAVAHTGTQRGEMTDLALKALQEAYRAGWMGELNKTMAQCDEGARQFEAGRQDAIDNIGEILENCVPRRANG